MDSFWMGFSFIDEVFTISFSVAILHGGTLRLYWPTLLHVFSVYSMSLAILSCWYSISIIPLCRLDSWRTSFIRLSVTGWFPWAGCCQCVTKESQHVTGFHRVPLCCIGLFVQYRNKCYRLITYSRLIGIITGNWNLRHAFVESIHSNLFWRFLLNRIGERKR